MSNIYIDNKEAVGMMLRQHIESGWADPSARTALYKIQRAKGGYIDLTSKEAESIIDVYRSFAEDRYWTPISEESHPYSKSTRTSRKERRGPTSYPRRIEYERGGQDI